MAARHFMRGSLPWAIKERLLNPEKAVMEAMKELAETHEAGDAI